jgi:hypothetical protein
MKPEPQSHSGHLLKGILLTHLILILHLVIVALLGVLVIFLGGFARHLTWILIGGGVLALLSAGLLYRYIRSRGRRTLHEMQTSDIVRGREVEISFLGGLASLRLGQPQDAIPSGKLSGPGNHHRLEDPRTADIRELSRLAGMYEADLITREEFDRAKARLLQSPAASK